MNCPSRTDEPEGAGFNQNPNALAADLTTRQDLNGRANSRELRRIASTDVENVVEDEIGDLGDRRGTGEGGEKGEGMLRRTVTSSLSGTVRRPREVLLLAEGNESGEGGGNWWAKGLRSVFEAVKKFGKFIGPGFMVSVLLLVSLLRPRPFEDSALLKSPITFIILFMY